MTEFSESVTKNVKSFQDDCNFPTPIFREPISVRYHFSVIIRSRVLTGHSLYWVAARPDSWQRQRSEFSLTEMRCDERRVAWSRDRQTFQLFHILT